MLITASKAEEDKSPSDKTSTMPCWCSQGNLVHTTYCMYERTCLVVMIIILLLPSVIYTIQTSLQIIITSP